MSVYKRSKNGCYHGDYTDPATGKRIRRALGTNDKTLATRILAKLREEAIALAAGLGDPHKEHADRPLSEHLDDWRQVLAAKRTPKHVSETVQSARDVLAGCRMRLWRELTHARVEMWITAPTQREKSVAWRNRRLRAIKSFAVWMVDGDRASVNPLARIKLDYIGARAERTKFRHALSDDDMRSLLSSTESDRRMLYLAAVSTGFRANELRTLTVDALDVDDCTITVEAAYSKHRRRDVQPITPGFAYELAEYLAGRRADDLMFPTMPRPESLAVVLREDATAAGIDAATLDFHCLRHTFITRLARADVHPRTAQDLARHSKVELTLAVYTHVGRGQLSAALDQLSDLSERNRKREVV